MTEEIFFKKISKNFCLTTLLKKRLWHRCFPVNFAKFLRTPFLTEQLRWLLLVTIIAKTNLFLVTML